MAVDIACGTSLLGLDLAARAIRSGQCTKAMISTAQMDLLPTTAKCVDKLGMLSKEGHCKAFDDSGDVFFNMKSDHLIFSLFIFFIYFLLLLLKNIFYVFSCDNKTFIPNIVTFYYIECS